MIVDGRRIARERASELRGRCRQLANPSRLSVISVGGDKATESFLKIKRAVGERIGITVDIHTFATTATEEEVKTKIAAIQNDADGIVVQLPLPEHYERERILSALLIEKDVDFLSSESLLAFQRGKAIGMPPVAGAVDEILTAHNVSLHGKQVGVIGQGKLVGEPVIAYLTTQGIEPVVFDEYTGLEGLDAMDVIVSGAGVPGLVGPEHIKDGVVLIDAGTSEQGGVVRGDVQSESGEKASLYTPVPGGVGPVTVVKLFENLILRAEHGQS